MRNIIDGNAVGWAFHSATKLNYAGIQTQAIFGYAQMLRNIALSDKAAVTSVLWDGRAKKRFALLSTYKETRERERQEDPERLENHAAYKVSIQVVNVLIKLLGINQVMHPDYEADDLAGLMVARYPGRKKLFTGDSDWLQLVNEETDWYDPRSGGKLITYMNFHEATGYATPLEHLNGKVLQGDGTDDIPGIDGYGKIEAAKFVAKWKSLQAFFDAVDAGTYVPASRKSKTAKTPHPEQTLASQEGRLLIERNFKLINLRNPTIDNPELIVMERGAPSAERVKVLFQRLGFVSLLRDFDAWIEPFGITPVLQSA